MRIHILSSPIEPEITPEEDSQEQRMMQLSREIAFEQEMLLERETNIKQIEADILDVNEIMRELSSMVYEQREMTSKFLQIIFSFRNVTLLIFIRHKFLLFVFIKPFYCKDVPVRFNYTAFVYSMKDFQR